MASGSIKVDYASQQQLRKANVLAKLPAVCRTCLTGESDLDSDLYPINEIFLEEEEITTQIQSFDEVLCLFVDDEVGKQHDRFPKVICLSCLEKARSAFQFIEMCRQTDALLEECFSETKPSLVEETGTKNVERLDEDSITEQIVDEESQDKTIPAKQECEDKPTVSGDFELVIIDDVVPSSGKRHTCNLCNKTFTQSQTLNRHRRIHSKDTHPGKPCSYCKRSFLRSDDLRRHIRTHTNERPYACKLCPRTFKQSFELKEHKESAHPEGGIRRVLTCKLCNKQMTTRNGLYVHMKTHRGEKNHSCTFCNKRFVTSGELTSHLRHIHTSEVNAELFPCGFDGCTRTFVTKAALRHHRVSKHEVSSQPAA